MLKQVNEEKLLNSFFNELWKNYTLAKSRVKNRLEAFALAYKHTLREFKISRIEVFVQNLDNGEDIYNVSDLALLKYFTQLAVAVKLNRIRDSHVVVSFDTDKSLVKVFRF